MKNHQFGDAKNHLVFFENRQHKSSAREQRKQSDIE